jgi:hypothetical protein
MKNLFLLPTDKPSRLWVNNLLQGKLELSEEVLPYNTSQNICITSDEEIKEENLTKSIYVIDVQNGNIGKLTCKNRFFKGSCKLIGIEWSNKQDIWNYNHIREIILTTDQDLIKDGVQAIEDEFLEWFVKNPSCEEVEVRHLLKSIFDPKTNEKYPVVQHRHFDLVKMICEYKYEIIIPQEETKKYKVMIVGDGLPKQETLEESGEYQQELFNYLYDLGVTALQTEMQDIERIVLKNYNINALDFEIDALKREIKVLKHQKEQDKNKYSDEDMIEASKYGYNFHKTTQFPQQEFEDSCIRNTQQWLNKFKKK